MQGAPPPPLPALVHIPELLFSLVSNVDAPLVAGSATSSTSSPATPASSPATPAGPAMYRALLEVLGGPGTPQDIGQACLAAAVVLPEPPMGAPAGAPLARCSTAGRRRRAARAPPRARRRLPANTLLNRPTHPPAKSSD
eukprot:tig00021146_g19042.t1